MRIVGRVRIRTTFQDWQQIETGNVPFSTEGGEPALRQRQIQVTRRLATLSQRSLQHRSIDLKLIGDEYKRDPNSAPVASGDNLFQIHQGGVPFVFQRGRFALTA